VVLGAVVLWFLVLWFLVLCCCGSWCCAVVLGAMVFRMVKVLLAVHIAFTARFAKVA